MAMIIRVHSSPQSTPWLFFAIYASPILHKRMHLWTHLKHVASEFNMPWLVMGNFNDLLYTKDELGGRPLIASLVHAFNDYLNYCDLFYLTTSGPHCTWTNKN